MGTCQCDEGFYGDSCSSKHDKLLLVFKSIACHVWITVETNLTKREKTYHKNKKISHAVPKVIATK